MNFKHPIKKTKNTTKNLMIPNDATYRAPFQFITVIDSQFRIQGYIR